jgi:hypothetical protein
MRKIDSVDFQNRMSHKSSRSGARTVPRRSAAQAAWHPRWKLHAVKLFAELEIFAKLTVETAQLPRAE